MNTLFYTYGTKVFMSGELTYYPYIENNNEGGEGTEFHGGGYKKAQASLSTTAFCF